MSGGNFRTGFAIETGTAIADPHTVGSLQKESGQRTLNPGLGAIHFKDTALNGENRRVIHQHVDIAQRDVPQTM
jgi:hypothetical protein